jgi:hypothetical protein
MPDMDINRQFANGMKEIYTRAKSEAGYTATAYLQMLGDHGPIETARRLVLSPAPSSGFTQLWERRRLDLTVEALVLEPRFAELFDDELRDRARDRLEQYGYAVSAQRGDDPTRSDPNEPSTLEAGAQSQTPHPPTPRAQRSAPAGWYEDPFRAARVRWWDGESWSEWTDANWSPPAR